MIDANNKTMKFSTSYSTKVTYLEPSCPLLCEIVDGFNISHVFNKLIKFKKQKQIIVNTISDLLKVKMNIPKKEFILNINKNYFTMTLRDSVPLGTIPSTSISRSFQRLRYRC